MLKVWRTITDYARVIGPVTEISRKGLDHRDNSGTREAGHLHSSSSSSRVDRLLNQHRVHLHSSLAGSLGEQALVQILQDQGQVGTPTAQQGYLGPIALLVGGRISESVTLLLALVLHAVSRVIRQGIAQSELALVEFHSPPGRPALLPQLLWLCALRGEVLQR